MYRHSTLSPPPFSALKTKHCLVGDLHLLAVFVLHEASYPTGRSSEAEHHVCLMMLTSSDWDDFIIICLIFVFLLCLSSYLVKTFEYSSILSVFMFKISAQRFLYCEKYEV